MNNNLYRKKSLERLSSPDQLNDYIKVTNPAVWLVLAAVTLALAMFVVWAVLGTVTVSTNCIIIAKDGRSEIYLPSSDANRLKEGINVELVGSKIGTITSVPDRPTQITSSFDSNAKSIGGMSTGDFYYVCTTDASFDTDGIYQVQVVFDEISPIAYLLNGTS